MGIGHYDNPYLVAEWHRDLPSGATCEPLRFLPPDGAMAAGWLYARGGEDTVAILAHPRADFSRHYAVPGLVDAGFAVLTLNTRFGGNEMSIIHEACAVDLGTAVGEMRKRFDRVVLIGNSGGGSLMTFYLHQALAPAGERLTQTPAGQRYDLNAFDLPPADLMVYLAAHPGEGHYLLHAIDPSVTDESDPLSCDADVDMYNAANGFAEPPTESRYDPEFLDRYRAAQRDRIGRLDETARAEVERRRASRADWSATADAADRRASIATRLLTIYRTDADPRFTDLSLDPSTRTYGSLWGTRPDWINYGIVGFSRVMSPEAWLSTWSGLSSNAEIVETGARMTLPCLHVSYTGDHCIFPSDADLICRSLATPDLTRVAIDANHYGFPVESGRDPAIETIVGWLRDR
ncbi:MAG TPA: alpha/beta hydrolase [Acidimicrobiia bacterium]|nr:alpha/beta hydrolase [Acidimicrobiia bacterium]